MSKQKSTGELAGNFGITVQHLNRLVDAGIIPKKGRNLFDADESIQAYIKHREEEVRKEYDNGARTLFDFEEEKATKMHYDAIRSKVKADIESGQSHEATAITELMGQSIAATRARILSIPNSTAATVADLSDAEACRKVLSEACREAAEQLADYDPSAIVGKARKDLLKESEPEPEADAVKK